MDIQAIFDAISESARKDRSRYQITLGEAIEELSKADAALSVKYQSGGSPSNPHSYRGYYSDLAFEEVESPTTVKVLLQLLKESKGRTFTGYKGGDFVMGDDTPLWKASYGCCGEAWMIFVLEADGIVVVTRDVD